jgi:hypothetical protein
LASSETRLTLEFGYRQVRLPRYERPLWLLVIKGFGEAPLMVLTTVRLNRKKLWWVVQAYLTRWRIEVASELARRTLRFAKQNYRFEDIRVLGYESLKNMMAMALLAVGPTGDAFRHDAPGERHQTDGAMPPRADGGQAPVRNPGLPVLRHHRRNQRNPVGATHCPV